MIQFYNDNVAKAIKSIELQAFEMDLEIIAYTKQQIDEYLITNKIQDPKTFHDNVLKNVKIELPQGLTDGFTLQKNKNANFLDNIMMKHGETKKKLLYREQHYDINYKQSFEDLKNESISDAYAKYMYICGSLK